MSESATSFLWCAVEGADEPTIFKIEFPHSADISDLKKFIVRDLITIYSVNAAGLELWKLQRDVATCPAPKIRSSIQQLGGLDQIASKIIQPYNKITEVFSNGHREGLVDIVVRLPAKKGSRDEPPAKRARMDDGNRSTNTGVTPSSSNDSNLSGSGQDAAPKTEEEMKEIVEHFLMRYDGALQNYLLGSPWNKYWEAPPSADPDIALFINDLKIPRISRNGAPMLLLHEIGNGIVDTNLVDEVFNGRSTFLANVSGSGKTRLLFEGLVRNWGFYFTALSDDSRDNIDMLGSTDIMQCINNHIRSSNGFNIDPEKLEVSFQDKAFRRNHQIAERGMCMVFMARVLIFEHFLKIARETQPTHSIDGFRKHWLFLQLRSPDILGSNIFENLMKILADADNAYLKIGYRKIGDKLRHIQREFNLDDEFICVLDEAQRASDLLNDAFQSDVDRAVKRPILRPIISTWIKSAEFPMVVSGTGLSINVVNDAPGSAIAKESPFTMTTETGSFDERNRQQDYIRRYMPKDLLESEAGHEFLERAWIWIHGRHRFTASLLDQLLQSSFRSPQATLNSYIEKLCGFRASDLQPTAMKEEGKFEGGEIGSETPFDFPKIRNDPQRLLLFKNLLYKWLLHKESLPLKKSDLRMVELGFARFHHDLADEAIVDEPLVLLAAVQELRNVPGFSFEDHVKTALLNSAGRGEHFEDFIGLYFASAFDKDHYLCEVFHFEAPIPRWAKQTAEIVSVVRAGGQTKAYPFHFLDSVAATAYIGFKSGNMEKTVEWFENPSTLICFPDKDMGPDVGLFIRLNCGQILPVVLQIKWNSNSQMSRALQRKAMSTVDPSKFYSHEYLKDEKYLKARERILNSFQTLNEPNGGSQVDDGFRTEESLLKVIASFPSEDQQGLPEGYASLNMDHCLRVMDSDHLLQTVAIDTLSRKHP